MAVVTGPVIGIDVWLISLLPMLTIDAPAPLAFMPHVLSAIEEELTYTVAVPPSPLAKMA